MKALLATLSLVAASLLTGCEHDLPPTPRESQAGRVPGQITQPDRSDDPFTREVSKTGY